MQSSTCGRFPDKIHTFRFFASASVKFAKSWRKPSTDRKPGLVAERQGAAAGLTSPPRRGSAHPKSYSRPHSPGPDPRLPPGKRTVSQNSRRDIQFWQLPCAPRSSLIIPERSLPRAHTHTPCPPKGAPASPPGSQSRCSPAALPAAFTQTCLPVAGWKKKPWLQSARGSGLKHPGGRTHPRPRPAEAPASAATRPPPRGAEPAAPQCPEPSAPSARKPRGGPAASGQTRPGHRTPPPGSLGLRTSGLSRGGTARGRGAGGWRAAGGGRAGARLCTCSLARSGDSGQPPPGPRGAGAAALAPAGGVAAGGAGDPHPTRCRRTSPLREATCRAKTLTHTLIHTHPRTHSLTLSNTPGEFIGTHTQTHIDTNTLGTATLIQTQIHRERRTLSDTNAESPFHRHTDTYTLSHMYTLGSVPRTQK